MDAACANASVTRLEVLRKTGDGRLFARLVFGLAVFISAFLLFQRTVS